MVCARPWISCACSPSTCYTAAPGHPVHCFGSPNHSCAGWWRKANTKCHRTAVQGCANAPAKNLLTVRGMHQTNTSITNCNAKNCGWWPHKPPTGNLAHCLDRPHLFAGQPTCAQTKNSCNECPQCTAWLCHNAAPSLDDTRV